MPLDFNYSTEKDAENVYHVLILCPEAMKIREKHREYGFPPPEEQREPCEACSAEILEWWFRER
jgi:hypothetical protein